MVITRWRPVDSTPRRRVLVAYDIAQARRRRRVAKALDGVGERVQKSVFLCELRTRDRSALRLHLRRWIDPRTDSLLMVDLGPAALDIEDRILSFGRVLPKPQRVLVI
jgi:CRISPR-associated protein Cas2